MRAVFAWMLAITGCAAYALFFSSAIQADAFTKVFLLVALGIAWLYFGKAWRERRPARSSDSAV